MGKRAHPGPGFGMSKVTAGSLRRGKQLPWQYHTVSYFKDRKSRYEARVFSWHFDHFALRITWKHLKTSLSSQITAFFETAWRAFIMFPAFGHRNMEMLGFKQTLWPCTSCDTTAIGRDGERLFAGLDRGFEICHRFDEFRWFEDFWSCQSCQSQKDIEPENSVTSQMTRVLWSFDQPFPSFSHACSILFYAGPGGNYDVGWLAECSWCPPESFARRPRSEGARMGKTGFLGLKSKGKWLGG